MGHVRLEGMQVCIQTLAQRFKLKYRYVALSHQIPRLGVLLSVIVGYYGMLFYAFNPPTSPYRGLIPINKGGGMGIRTTTR